MKQYPKTILSIDEQVEAYRKAGLVIADDDYVKKALSTVGYYRLRGYSYHLYNKRTKKYNTGTSFEQIMMIYQFDTALADLVFMMATEIEIALRARLNETLLAYNDALVYMDPSIFNDKKKYWENLGKISSEIARSKDLFIQHQFKNHEGQVPLWAAVEVMSFGTLSKLIENLPIPIQKSLSHYYLSVSPKGNTVNSYRMICSWIHSISVLRNICAHRGRIYNREFAIQPTLPKVDAVPPGSKRVYPIIIAMKCLRPSDESWNRFAKNLIQLMDQYSSVIELERLGFPSDWKLHLTLS